MSNPQPLKPKKRLLLFSLLAVGAFMLGLCLSYWLFPEKAAPPAATVMHLAGDAPFRIKTKRDLLGLQLTQIRPQGHPQEFLLVSHVPRALSDRMYGKPVNLEWATSIANQYLKVRDADKDRPPRTVQIDEIKTVRLETLQLAERELPYWEILVRFHLGSETEPRFYEAGIVRGVEGNDGASDTLLFAFTPKGAYRRDLFPELLGQMRFDPP